MLNRISINEANKNFLKVIQTVDETGAAVIFNDNRQYILFEYSENESERDEYINSTKFRGIAESVLNRHIEAFRELAK